MASKPTPSNGPHPPKDNNVNDQSYEQCNRKKKSRNQSETYVSNRFPPGLTLHHADCGADQRQDAKWHAYEQPRPVKKVGHGQKVLQKEACTNHGMNKRNPSPQSTQNPAVIGK